MPDQPPVAALPSPERSPGFAPAGGPAVLSPGRAYLLLAAVVLLWGANWPVMKVGLGYIPPLSFAAARMALGAATLFAVLLASGRFAWPTRRDLPVILSVGLLQMAAFLALVSVALLRVDAGRSAILAYTTPLWVWPGAVLLLGERVTGLRLAGLLLGFAGVAAMFNPLAFDWSDGATVTGNGLLMLAAIVWAASILHVRRHVWRLSPLQLAPWQMAAAIPPLLGLALWSEGGTPIRWSGELAAVLAYNGPAATAFCFWAAVSVTRALPAITTSLAFLAVPAAAVAASALTLGEPLTATLAASLGLILGGLALVNLADRRGR